jgi:hypothetical protein
MSRTAQAGPAIGYLNTELERVWRGGHVVDSPVVCVSATWISGAKGYVVDVVDMYETARGNSIKRVRQPLAGQVTNAVPAIAPPAPAGAFRTRPLGKEFPLKRFGGDALPGREKRRWNRRPRRAARRLAARPRARAAETVVADTGTEMRGADPRRDRAGTWGSYWLTAEAWATGWAAGRVMDSAS